jgi:hypothetical protein
MIVKESSEAAFGTEIKGITVQLTMDEAKAVAKVLLQGVVNPPKSRDGFNTDWDAKKIGGQIYDEIRKIARI